MAEQDAQKAETTPVEQTQRKLEALEAQAVAQATATADAAFIPSASLMNAKSAAPLLKQVDGPKLDASYEAKESVYVGRSVPVSAGGALTIPIQVTTPGSIVEYTMENKSHDVGFGIQAEREEGVTVVKESSRINATKVPVNGKFLVGSVPCQIQFLLDNTYSYMREKIVSYRITVTPPSVETLQAGRRRRAQACLKAVQDDQANATQRYNKAMNDKVSLDSQVQRLEKELEQAKQALVATEKEEKWLQERIQIRKEQSTALQTRLDQGWPEEQK